MPNRPKPSKVPQQRALPFWVLVGVSCLAIVGFTATISTRVVKADAVPGTPSIAAVSPIASSATPDLQSASVQNAHGKVIRGVASWYGSVFDGRKTASGETFDMNDMTACHPSLPFGSEVRVVNLRNKRSVVVRITDRADLVKGRVIDLSFAAAEKLGMTRSGLARVSVEVLSLGHPATGD